MLYCFSIVKKIAIQGIDMEIVDLLQLALLLSLVLATGVLLLFVRRTHRLRNERDVAHNAPTRQLARNWTVG